LIEFPFIPLTVGLWLAIVPMCFYYYFILSPGSTIEEKIKKKMYGWGIQVYIFGIMIVTIGNVFCMMSKGDFVHLLDYLSENLPQIIAFVIWILAALYFIFFFKFRRPLKRKSVESEFRGSA